MIKKIIIALFIAHVGLSTAWVFYKAQQVEVSDSILVGSGYANSQNRLFTWPSPFDNPDLFNYSPQSMPETFPHSDMSMGSSVEVAPLAVPMGKVNVGKKNGNSSAKLRSVGGGGGGSATSVSRTNSNRKSAEPMPTFAYRNFVAISSISTSSSLNSSGDFSSKNPQDNGKDLPPPPNVVVEDNVLPIGDELAILLLFMLLYVVKRRAVRSC